MALIFLKYTTPPPPQKKPPKFHAGTCSHLKGFGGPAERHVSRPLSAVFAVRQARGALHLRKRVATQGNGRGGRSVERPRPREERKEQPQNTFPPERQRKREQGADRQREREEGVAGTMPLQLQVQWLRRCVCDCVRREHFLFCVN